MGLLGVTYGFANGSSGQRRSSSVRQQKPKEIVLFKTSGYQNNGLQSLLSGEQSQNFDLLC